MQNALLSGLSDIVKPQKNWEARLDGQKIPEIVS